MFVEYSGQKILPIIALLLLGIGIHRVARSELDLSTESCGIDTEQKKGAYEKNYTFGNKMQIMI